MNFNSISSVSTAATTSATTSAVKTSEKSSSDAQTTESTKSESNSGVVYEKSSTTNTKTATSKANNSAIAAKLKADAEQRTSQLRSLVEKMMTKQGEAIGNADSMWSFLAKGNFSVSADVKAQAQADIAEDGYWGVNQTSDRIVDFAKALAGNDPEKADKMLEAFKKGFQQATKSWGGKLPDISQRTYDAVLEKIDAWKNETVE